MGFSREPSKRGGVVGTALLGCGLAALGIGCLVAGKIALGVLVLFQVGGLVAGEYVSYRGSEALALRYVVARPFFMGGWLVALAAVIVASKQSLDWVVILPLGLIYIGLGVAFVVAYRRIRSEDDRLN